HLRLKAVPPQIVGDALSARGRLRRILVVVHDAEEVDCLCVPEKWERSGDGPDRAGRVLPSDRHTGERMAARPGGREKDGPPALDQDVTRAGRDEVAGASGASEHREIAVARL